MALLSAYFDETGLHQADVCIVAGFVGNDAQWLAFIHDWVDAIKPAKNLHMRRLRWNQHPESTARRLAKLGPIPHKYNLRPVVAGLNWNDFDSIVKPVVDNKFVHPYIICALIAIDVVLYEIAQDDEVMFYFDRQEGLRRELMDELRNIMFDYLRMDKRVKGIEFIDRESTVCLDPADYLAYIARERNLDFDSFRSRAGESIIGSGGNGGWIPAPYLKLIADEQVNRRPIMDHIKELMQNPYWGGPE